MKTLNLTLRTILLTFILVSTTTTAFAYDMYVNGVYYNIDGENATVTYQDRNSFYDNYGNQYYKYYNDNTGNIIIPETITLDGKTYTVTAIGDYAFCHTNSEGISGITIPNTVTSIGKYAFQDCDKISELTIPTSVTSIGDYAFLDCDYIFHISIPNSVISIGNRAFNSCDRLKSVVIGNSVSSIGEFALSTGSLSYLTCLATTPPSSPGGANTSSILYVPLESVELYRTTSGWHSFSNIRGFGENYLSMPDVTTLYGDTIVIPVTLENEHEITAFQTDLYLPNGFELLKDDDEYMVTLTSRKSRDHVIMANEMPDGSVRILSYSPTLKTFSENSGELFYFTLKVPEDADGNYRIELNNTIVTTADEDEVHALNASNNIKVFSYILGDVNRSGDITVSDVVETARYILNMNPDPFIFDAADITSDGRITITDVVKIAHMVLDADYDEPEMRLTSNGNNSERMGSEINQQTVGITLDNNREYTAFQLDLVLPEGMTASEFALTNRANGLDLVVKDKGNGRIRLMGYTPTLKTIQGHDGSLLTFKAAGGNDIVVNHIELVTPEGETVHPSAFTIPMNQQITAVKELSDSKAVDHIDYYNLAGQQVDSPDKGVTLVVTTYQNGTRNTSKIIR